MKLLKPIILFSILSLLIGCSKIHHKSLFHLAHTPFESKNITFKTNGYYFMEKTFEKGEKYINEQIKTDTKSCGIMPIIFYADGFVRRSEFIHGLKPYKDEQSKRDSIEKNLKELESSFVNNTFHVQIKNSIWDWGKYRQKGNEILIQYYSNHFGDFRLIDLKGEIKNDSTIIFSKQYGYKQPNYPYIINEEINETYRFKEFHTKPDSSNYIKSNLHKF